MFYQICENNVGNEKNKNNQKKITYLDTEIIKKAYFNFFYIEH